jgi:hypothetical protein
MCYSSPFCGSFCGDLGSRGSAAVMTWVPGGDSGDGSRRRVDILVAWRG